MAQQPPSTKAAIIKSGDFLIIISGLTLISKQPNFLLNSGCLNLFKTFTYDAMLYFLGKNKNLHVQFSSIKLKS